MKFKAFTLIASIILPLLMGPNSLWNPVEVNYTTAEYETSTEDLDNPYCGYTALCGYFINDDGAINQRSTIQKNISKHIKDCGNKNLVILQFLINRYNEGPISPYGLDLIAEILDTWIEQTDCEIIVRPIYDWEGHADRTEPQTLDIVSLHIAQLSELFNQRADRIYMWQGVVVGNWGEMNGGRLGNFQTFGYLVNCIDQCLNDEIFLAVRTPRIYRAVMGDSSEPASNKDRSTLAGRLSLYNDGMLGSESDTGTYGDYRWGESGAWVRHDELAFQSKLCMNVPNGGEVINDNYYNNLENAILDLSTMHVSYLNGKYDLKVLNKWGRSTVITDDEWNNMNGKDYIGRHLGYRYEFVTSELGSYSPFFDQTFPVNITIKNSGFAPAYRPVTTTAYIIDSEENIVEQFTLDDVRNISNGEEMTCTIELQKEKYLEGEYHIYLQLKDRILGKSLTLGNVYDSTSYGIEVGSFCLQQLSH